jgi:hypothetical protein
MKKFNNSYHSFHYLTPDNTRLNRAPGNKFNLAISISPDGRRNSIVSLKKFTGKPVIYRVEILYN